MIRGRIIMNVSAQSQTTHLKATRAPGTVRDSDIQIAVPSAVFRTRLNRDCKRSFMVGKRGIAYVKRQWSTWTTRGSVSHRGHVQMAEK